MNSQITVRIPTEAVDYLDQLVGEGVVRSRADGVAQALQNDRRRRLAERDAAIYRAHGDDPEMVEMVRATPRVALGVD